MLRKLKYLVFGLVGATAVACSSVGPTSQDVVPQSTELVGQVGTFLKGKGKLGDQVCQEITGNVTAAIGASGGEISLGGVTLDFPSGALQGTTQIVMVPVPGSQSVQFYPEGLVFPSNKRPVLTFDTDCIGNPSSSVIVYTNDSGLILENKGGNHGDGHSVSAYINHFSRYAVDW